MKNIYVTELTEIDDSVIRDLNRRDNWLAKEVEELIDSYGMFKDFEIDNGNGDMLVVDVTDSEELAHWVIDNGIKNYDYLSEHKSTRDSPDFEDNDGEFYKVRSLVGDVLEDFLSDKVSNLFNYSDIPLGISLSRYEKEEEK